MSAQTSRPAQVNHDGAQSGAPPRKFRRRPQAVCPHCGTPALAYSSPPGMRYIRCPLCPWRSKEAR